MTDTETIYEYECRDDECTYTLLASDVTNCPWCGSGMSYQGKAGAVIDPRDEI